MRDPAMHIKLSDFIVILKAMGISKPESTAEAIFIKAVPLNVKTRYSITGNTATVRKATKAVAVAKATTMTVQRFNRILSSERRHAGHKFFKDIMQSDPSYGMLKEVAILAVEFSTSCDFESVDEGCRVYVNLGLQMMKKSNQYGLNKFKFYDPKIYSLYESYDTITNDPLPKETKKYFKIYSILLQEYANVSREDLTIPENYVAFILARLESEQVKAHPEDWVRAQFEELGRAFDAVPNPNQLFSVNAVKRYYDYMKSTNRKAQGQEEEIIVADYEAPKSEFQLRYQEKLKQKLQE